MPESREVKNLDTGVRQCDGFFAPRPQIQTTMRADQLLVARGLMPSRTAARRAIEAGRVSVARAGAWLPVRAPAQDLAENAEIVLRPDAADRYVSRGGLKLAGAIERCGLDVAGKTCLDMGQSTGGFSDCLLQAGAARVVGVDVGHGQLHPSLREEARLVGLEGLHARHLCPADLGEHWPASGFDLIVADLSFISLGLVMPVFPPLLAGTGELLALVKPQFEVGPAHLGKGGIVRDANLYPAVEARIRAAATAAGLVVLDYFDSPITGGDGNREFFIRAGQAQGRV